jgi:hypothetical protein
MTTPRRVETAPCTTGANIVSRASTVRRRRSPRLPTKHCTMEKNIDVIGRRESKSSKEQVIFLLLIVKEWLVHVDNDVPYVDLALL